MGTIKQTLNLISAALPAGSQLWPKALDTAMSSIIHEAVAGFLHDTPRQF